MRRLVTVEDEQHTGDVANLGLVGEAHFGGGLLHLYFERSARFQDEATFTGESAQKLWAVMG